MERPLYSVNGRPLANDDLTRQLGLWDLLSQMLPAAIGGTSPYQNFILWGCAFNQSGSNYTLQPGMVSIGGEMIEVGGGTYTTSTVYIHNFGGYNTALPRTFADGNDYDCVEYRDAQVSTSIPSGSYIKVEFGKPLPTLLRALTAKIVPQGVVNMWAGSPTAIPDGWALCNGQTVNGYTTPDLRSRFVVGYNPADADHNAVGKTGGDRLTYLIDSNLPPHTHYLEGATTSGGAFKGITINTGVSTATILDTSSGYGAGTPFENRPPFYTLCYIVKL